MKYQSKVFNQRVQCRQYICVNLFCHGECRESILSQPPVFFALCLVTATARSVSARRPGTRSWRRSLASPSSASTGFGTVTIFPCTYILYAQVTRESPILSFAPLDSPIPVDRSFSRCGSHPPILPGWTFCPFAPPQVPAHALSVAGLHADGGHRPQSRPADAHALDVPVQRQAGRVCLPPADAAEEGGRGRQGRHRAGAHFGRSREGSV